MIFWTKFAKKIVIPVENRRNEQHHQIPHIRISLGTKFQLKLNIRISLGTKFYLKLTNLIFCTKYTQKGIFQSKAEKVNITNEFCIFELVYNHSQNIWK